MFRKFDMWLQQLAFNKTAYGLLFGVAALLLVVASVLAPATNALSISSARDCDNNAVIRCGALTITELRQKYATGDVAAIFNHFGISASDMNNLHNSNTVEGKVTQGGRVVVDGKTVATNAMTAGRQNISGSQAVTSGGARFYVRPPSVSFQASSLKAFVVTDKNGQFLFAIIASCGNPVKATPVKVKEKTPTTPAPVQPATKPKPTPPQPQPTPPAPTPTTTTNTNTNNNNNTSNSSSSSEANASANVTINQPAPEKVEQPAPTPPQTVVERVEVPVATSSPAATTTTPQELPKTGTETVSSTLGLAGIATFVGATLHLLFTRYRYRAQ